MTQGLEHIALFVTNLGIGGAEVVMVRTAQELAARGYRVDLVLCEATGPRLAQVPEGVRVLSLARSSGLAARWAAFRADPGGFWVNARPILLPFSFPKRIVHLKSLVEYLRRESPDALLAALTPPNLMAVWARRLAGVKTRIVVSHHNSLSATMNEGNVGWRKKYLGPAVSRAYMLADGIIGVSDGVSDDLALTGEIPRELITTVYNPVVDDDFRAGLKRVPDHPWLAEGEPPVVMGCGSLIDQKDFPTLLRAFAIVRRDRRARLMILGSDKTEEKTARGMAELRALASELGIADDLALPGFVSDPQAWMSRAAVFALSSRFEGLSCVLIEAIAAGCPAVSTDCPYGPREVLLDGKLGPLVGVGDHEALAAGIKEVLDAPPAREKLTARGEDFSVARAVDRYLELLVPGGR